MMFARFCSHWVQIFDVNKLDLQKVGKAFGFGVPPNVNLDVHSSKAGFIKPRRGGGGGYGKADHARAKMYRGGKSDGRQFSK